MFLSESSSWQALKGFHFKHVASRWEPPNFPPGGQIQVKKNNLHVSSILFGRQKMHAIAISNFSTMNNSRLLGSHLNLLFPPPPNFYIRVGFSQPLSETLHIKCGTAPRPNEMMESKIVETRPLSEFPCRESLGELRAGHLRSRARVTEIPRQKWSSAITYAIQSLGRFHHEVGGVAQSQSQSQSPSHVR